MRFFTSAVFYADIDQHVDNNRFDAAVKSALGGSTGGSSPPPPPPPTPGSHQLHPNGNTSKCLDVVGGVFANGTPVDMYAPILPKYAVIY